MFAEVVNTSSVEVLLLGAITMTTLVRVSLEILILFQFISAIRICLIVFTPDSMEKYTSIFCKFTPKWSKNHTPLYPLIWPTLAPQIFSRRKCCEIRDYLNIRQFCSFILLSVNLISQKLSTYSKIILKNKPLFLTWTIMNPHCFQNIIGGACPPPTQ